MSFFKSKIIAITGGASGIGLATAKLLAKRGVAAVCIGDFNDKSFPRITAEIQEENSSTIVETTKLDVSSSSAVDSWIQGIVSKFSRLDGAANVAGIPQEMGARSGGPNILSETDDMWRRIMGVNLDGVFFCTRAEVKAMIGLGNTTASIVNVSSLAALSNVPDCFSYGVSKSAVASLSVRISKDVLPYGIRVNTVMPSATNTPMLSKFFPNDTRGIVAGRGYDLVESTDVAEATVWLLSEEASKISGTNIPVGGSAP